MKALVVKGMKLDNIVLNAGVLKYPNVSRSMGSSREVDIADSMCRGLQRCMNLYPIRDGI